jgi:hypothetical protein
MHEVLNAIIMAYISSDTGGELPPHTLKHIGRVTEQVPRKEIQNLIVTLCFRTLHKIHTFVETQQRGSKVRTFFRQGELKALLKDCKAGLEQAFKFFEVRHLNDLVTI